MMIKFNFFKISLNDRVFTLTSIFTIFLLFGCKQNFEVLKLEETKENKELSKYFLRDDPDYNNKTLFYILKIREGDSFFLKKKNGKILLNKKIKNASPGALTPSSYFEYLKRDITYVFKINGKTHKINKKMLQKFKYVTVELSEDGVNYIIIYTNNPKKYG